MVTIRLARHGSKKNPFYHITVADRSAKRDGRFIERVGFFNPVAKGRSEELRVNLERIDHWLAVGAQPSEMVRKLVKRARLLPSEVPSGVPSEVSSEVSSEVPSEAPAPDAAEAPAPGAPGSTA